MKDSADKLPLKRERALAALLASPTIRDAAQAAGVSEVTLWRYLQDDAFAERYRRARGEVVEHTVMRLQADSAKAAQVLIGIAEDGLAPASARVSAAKTIIEQAYKGFENSELLARLKAVEALLGDAKGIKP